MSFTIRPVTEAPLTPTPLRCVGSMPEEAFASTIGAGAQIAQRPDGSIVWVAIPDSRGRVHVYGPGGKRA